jgi:3-oxoacyl-[acyl-carrier protein] reductase
LEQGGFMRHVFITGSSRGIGFGIAKAFVQNGDRVTLNGRNDGIQLKKAMEELNTEGFLADLSNYERAKAVFNRMKPVDVLVNNAGSEYFGLFNEMAPPEIKRVLDDNLMTTINATHLAIPYMVRKKSGIIINVTSVWGITGASCEAVYSAAKAGVNGFTRSMAKELGFSGVRVNAIACGAFETRMNERLSPEEKNDFIGGIPLGRFGEADEVGFMAVFLASEKAAYLTGQVITLDGGLTSGI